MIVLQLNLLLDGANSVVINDKSVETIRSLIFSKSGLNEEFYFLTSNGKLVYEDDDSFGYVQAIPKLRGGKGGFGSMLRAIGAQIEKTTNREACRDLSGRRLRDINEEQRLKKWISQQAEREREIEERKKKKLEKLSRQPKHEFNDEDYDTERADLTEKISDSIEHGVKAASSTVKRNQKETLKPIVPVKKKKTIMDLEFSSSDDDEEDKPVKTTKSKQTVKKKKTIMDLDVSSSDEDEKETAKPVVPVKIKRTIMDLDVSSSDEDDNKPSTSVV